MARQRNGGHARWLLVAASIWGATATGYAVINHTIIQRLTEEASLRQTVQDDKVRALTRRLVGVASHQVLEEEGLSGRLADIIARQVDLESRQSLLATMAERTLATKPMNDRSLNSPTPAITSEPTQGERPRRNPDARDIAPSERPNPARPGRSGGLRSDPALSAAELKTLSARDQFSRLEASLNRVETAQLHVVTTLVASSRETTERIRAVVADLPLTVAFPKGPLSAPQPRNTFASAVAEAEDALAESNRWRITADSLPLLAPIEGGAGVTSNFGMRSDPFTGTARMHAGMDFRSAVGTPVRAAASGRVITAGQSGGYGNLVEIDHGQDVVTRYGHLSSTSVAVDQTVSAGVTIGLVGSTGRSTGPHLHYETRLASAPIDPGRFISAGRRLIAAGKAEAIVEPEDMTSATMPPEGPADAAD